VRLGALANRSYQIYLAGNAISGLGTWSQRIGIGWLSWDLTHSTSWVGGIALAQMLPLIIFGPLFGAVLDRSDHRRYALLVNVLLGLLSLALYVLTAAGLMHIGLLALMAVLLGLVSSAYHAARLTLVNDIVEPQHLPSAIAMNSAMFNVTRAVGPALAGITIARYGIAVSFAINAASFIGMLTALSLVQLRPRQTRRETHGLIAESIAGLRYVIHHAGLFQLLMLSAVTSILGRGIVELMPAFADAVFARGSLGLAQLTTAGGIGAIAGAVVLSQAQVGRQLALLTRVATLGVGVVVCLFGLSTAFWLGLLVSGALGFAVVLCGIGLQVRLQAALHDSFRGRVLGVWTSVALAGPGLGLRAVTIAAGLLCIALVTWITFSEYTVASNLPKDYP
jgi:MFS family permease